jgi:diaminopimelate decarboxylase
MGLRAKVSHLKRIVGPAARKFTNRLIDLPPALWGLSRDAKGELTLSGVCLSELTTKYGSPLFVVDAQRLDRNVASFQATPEGARAGVECFYSYKTNPIPGVLSRLHEREVGAEVISEYELWLAQKLGVPGERIVMNGPGRTVAALERGIELDALIVLNHREEVELVAELARGLGKRARVGLRVVTSGGWANQFGEPIGAEALSAFRALLARPELEVLAVHAHLGSELADAAGVSQYVADLLAFCDLLHEQLRFWPRILDVGGSLGCSTTTKLDARALRLNSALGLDIGLRDPGSVLGIEDYVRSVVSSVEAHCMRKNAERPRIFVEPGRALTSNAQMLLCQVMTTKQSGTPGLTYAVLDAGINIAEPMRNEYHQIFALRASDSAEQLYRIVGPICTPMDTLAWCRRLPSLRPGSQLAIMDAGGYFVPFSTSFSFPQPGVVMLDGVEQTSLRRGETFADIVKRDSF